MIKFKGNALARAVLQFFGWRVLWDGFPSARGVIMVYPHTSNWDFFLGLFTKWGWGLPVRFWGKDSLFKIPLIGRWMRWVGGVPVARTGKHNMVTDTVAQMQASDFFWLALAPEGTRKKIPGWRSGFYRVAVAAQVPICVAYFDYVTKTVGANAFFTPTGDETSDMASIAQVLQGKLGRVPANMSPIRLLDASVARDASLVNKSVL